MGYSCVFTTTTYTHPHRQLPLFKQALRVYVLLALAGLLGVAPAQAEGAWQTYPIRNGAIVIPVPADYSGDGATDLAYLDPASGDWHYLASDNGFHGPDRVAASGFRYANAQPIPADYDGDGRADPAYVYQNSWHWIFVYRASRSKSTHYHDYAIGATALTPFVADIDGDGRADPLVYNPLTGVIYGLKSSADFDGAPSRIFTLATNILNGKPFVVDYDNGRPDPNDKADPAYPRGRDFLDDLAVLAPDGTVHVFTSHYGHYNQPIALTGIAQGSDTPISGDFDGDGIKDIGVYRPGDPAQFRVLQSGQGFGQASLMVYPLGATTPNQNDLAVPGRYDLDAKTDLAVYRLGQAGPGEWRVAFSENALNTPPTTYPSPLFGLGMANWDNSLKTCYESELGAGDSADDTDTYVAGQMVPCSDEMFYDTNGLSEMAQTFSQQGVTYRLHPRALDVSWGDYLDPRANATMFMFKYLAPPAPLLDQQRRAYLTYAHDIPGAIQVQFSLAQCRPGADGRCQDPDGGRRLVYTDGSAIWQRAALKQWLLDHRQGPYGDRHHWYAFLVGSEMDYYAQTSPDTYALILRDYTHFLAEVRNQLRADYGLTIQPTIVLSSAAMGCDAVPSRTTVRCAFAPRHSEDEDTWPVIATYYQAVLERLTRPLALDLDHDGLTTGRYETWTQADVDNFLQFFQYYSLDPFLNQPVASDTLLGQSGQPQVSDLERYAAGAAKQVRAAAARFYVLPGCWNGFTQQFEACRRSTYLPQLGTRYYSFHGQGWVGPPCPMTPPDKVCDDIDFYPFDDVRYNTLYVTARLTQRLVADLGREPGHVAGWAYWQASDARQGFDPVAHKTWGSLDGALEPVIDWDPRCVGQTCDKLNVRLTPLGQVYLAAAAGDYRFKPGDFTYVGNDDDVSGSMRLLRHRPTAWWP